MDPVKKSGAWIFNNKLLPEVAVNGIFMGMSVEIVNNEEIKILNEAGSWGEGSLSRSVPFVVRKHNTEDLVPKISLLQYNKRLEWKQKYGTKDTGQVVKLIMKSTKVSNKIEEEITEELENPFSIDETLVLFLEEAFFLSNTAKCLNVKSLDGNVFNGMELWTLFCQIKYNFIECFVTYLYLKSKNWIIKPGIKFGGHFCKF